MTDWLNAKRPLFLPVSLLALLLAAALAAPATLRAEDDEAAAAADEQPATAEQEEEEAEKEPDVIFVPTPEEVVDKMLELAKPKKGEVLYDLGCGDGRIVITAAKKFGVKGIGVDIDPQRIKESVANAKEAGVSDRVKFIKKDLFTMDFKDADVMALYLLTTLNERLRPRLLEQMRPGARVVSHAFSMGEWEPDEEVTVDPGGQTVYFWIIPAKVEGSQTVKIGGKDVKLDLKQKYQMVTGTATIDGKKAEISEGRLRGRELTFKANGKEHKVMIGRDADGASIAEGAAEGDDAARTAGEEEKGEAGGSEKPQDEPQADKDGGDTGAESEKE
jgi:SAM-dependent methyltransferase